MAIEHFLPAISRPSICDVFKAASIDTWKRIGFSRSTKNMKCHETALTQNLVYEMRLAKDKFSHLDYQLYESKDEKANGSDMLFRMLHHDGKVYTYAIQAKIIYHTITTRKKIKLNDGWYTQLKHMVSKKTPTPQVDKLLDFAKANGFIPMYLLYNYVDKVSDPKIDESYGCTLASAQYLKDNYQDPVDHDLRHTVKFTDLHPAHAFPWEQIVCKLPSLSKESLLGSVGLPPVYPLKEGGRDAMTIDPDWDLMTKFIITEEILESERIKTQEKIVPYAVEDEHSAFNPKYIFDIGLDIQVFLE